MSDDEAHRAVLAALANLIVQGLVLESTTDLVLTDKGRSHCLKKWGLSLTTEDKILFSLFMSNQEQEKQREQ